LSASKWTTGISLSFHCVLFTSFERYWRLLQPSPTNKPPGETSLCIATPFRRRNAPVVNIWKECFYPQLGAGFHKGVCIAHSCIPAGHLVDPCYSPPRHASFIGAPGVPAVERTLCVHAACSFLLARAVLMRDPAYTCPQKLVTPRYTRGYLTHTECRLHKSVPVKPAWALSLLSRM